MSARPRRKHKICHCEKCGWWEGLTSSDRRLRFDTRRYLTDRRDGKPAQGVFIGDTREAAMDLDFGDLLMPAAPDQPGRLVNPTERQRDFLEASQIMTSFSTVEKPAAGRATSCAGGSFFTWSGAGRFCICAALSLACFAKTIPTSTTARSQSSSAKIPQWLGRVTYRKTCQPRTPQRVRRRRHRTPQPRQAREVQVRGIRSHRRRRTHAQPATTFSTGFVFACAGLVSSALSLPRQQTPAASATRGSKPTGTTRSSRPNSSRSRTSSSWCAPSRSIIRTFPPAITIDSSRSLLTWQRWSDRGDWNVYTGQYFPQFDGVGDPANKPPRHVRKAADAAKFVKPWHTRWISGDWGYEHPACFHWHAKDEHNRIVTYDELWDRRVGETEWATTHHRTREALAGAMAELSAPQVLPVLVGRRQAQPAIAAQVSEVDRPAGFRLAWRGHCRSHILPTHPRAQECRATG
jgi:hypothetical protein